MVRGPRAVEFGSRPVRAVPDPHASRAPPGRLPSCRCFWDFSILDLLFDFFFLMPPVEPLPPPARCIETFSSPSVTSSP